MLIFDLVPWRRTPTPLPAALRSFIEKPEHTFFGMGLTEDLARLAFEFDCLGRGVDFLLRAWPGRFKLGGGLAGLANTLLGTAVQQSKNVSTTNWEVRSLQEKHLTYLAEDGYLSWGIAQALLDKAPVDSSWLITEIELYARGSGLVERGLLAAENPSHDWSAAAAEPALIARRTKRLRRQRYRERQREKRKDKGEHNRRHTTVAAHAGLPALDALLTDDEAEAEAFLRGWAGTTNFGLGMEFRT